uniref:Secreted protein n=1 Tax=Achlya hypogyna TaxID=1202772 RepID=A0A0A7CNN5_ACHHY|nr:secreted protein [Achlya hypogyna]
MLRIALAATAVASAAALAPCSGEDVGMAVMGALMSPEAAGCAKDTGNDNIIGSVWTHAQAVKITTSSNCAQMWDQLAAGVKTLPECIYHVPTGMTSTQYAAMSFSQFANDIIASTGGLPQTPVPAPTTSTPTTPKPTSETPKPSSSTGATTATPSTTTIAPSATTATVNEPSANATTPAAASGAGSSGAPTTTMTPASPKPTSTTSSAASAALATSVIALAVAFEL